MKSKNYVELAVVTDNKDYSKPVERYDSNVSRLLHGAIGLSTESNEVLDALKKYVYYGKDLDFTNVKEELGDLLWYVAIMCDELNISIEEVMDMNINKLRKRYGEKFSEEKAINRNVKEEYKVLKDSSN